MPTEVHPAHCERIAVEDPAEVAAANPIHDEKATGYGYAGAIVAGIHTYGWMVPAILDAVGDGAQTSLSFGQRESCLCIRYSGHRRRRIDDSAVAFVSSW